MKRTAGKIAITILLVLIYFFVWRPVRVATTQHIGKPFAEYLLTESNPNVHIDREARGVSFDISWVDSQKQQVLKYRPPTGFFFLLALVSMVFLTREIRFYLYLLGFHILSFILVLLLLIPGFHGYFFGFWGADLIITYLVPVFSMAYIPWLIYLKKNSSLT
ncbi:hypothetical protein NC796_06750 [Aliifodinibius sp. S!AR15-10]|uniref:hypothetical protein n=1 Tax=Aliifodinibius sp. S!AR15-10 TaxID=2950437 RepID=UPI00285D2BCF|nr:hypothetical protein [Aliifodinibius sp. S!AR15-10]MDR8390827.1 hypothetical protein [Aliifodinibius sp. S!AR15-10]